MEETADSSLAKEEAKQKEQAGWLRRDSLRVALRPSGWG